MASYRVEIKRSAQKELAELPKSDLRRVVAVIEALAVNPRPPGCQKLSAREQYRARVGVYRVLYEIHDDYLLICVVKVAHRKEVYR